jgi:Flp pilus assembly protein TadG
VRQPTKSGALARSIVHRACRVRRDIRATASVEFALILPVMAAFLAISVVLGEGVAIWQKVSATSRTITDLVTQYSTLSQADLQEILNAAAYTMAPYSSANLSMVVSEIQTNAAGQATVTWSQPAFNGVALTLGQTVTLPAQIDQPNITLILGQVQYTYTPLNIFYPGLTAIPLSDASYWSPRMSSTVLLTP